MSNIRLLEPYYDAVPAFSSGGLVYLLVGLVILILSNAVTYLLIKSFNLKSDYGRFLGGVIILFITFLLTLSTNDDYKFRSALLFGLGEIIIGGLDIINYRLNSSLPLLIPDPGCASS
jgi:hypothetical protein